MKTKKEKRKKIILPNELSFGRWILVIVVAIAIGMTICLFTPIFTEIENREDFFFGISYADFFGILTFIPMTVAFVISLKLIGKTSIKDFILGVGGKINVKTSLIILGLHVAGMALAYLFVINKLEWRGVSWREYSFLLFFMSMTAWFQTTFEELVFRGPLLRWACKNDVKYTKKAFICGAVNALIFALFHAGNPELLSQSGFGIILTVFSYAIPGFMFYWADMHFGNLMPGIIMHWANNFILYVIVTLPTDSVAYYPTLFIDHSPQTPFAKIASTLILYIPCTIYIVVGLIKRKKAEAKVKAEA
jgi:membrane protease YdiL (CAAX protease family)